MNITQLHNSLLLAIVFSIASSHASSIRTVAFTGHQAPGTETGVVFFNNIDFPVLNNSGEVAFSARLSGPGTTGGNNSNGIWSEGGGAGLKLVARGASLLPGATPPPGTNPGTVFSGFRFPLLNDSGQTAFVAGVDFSTGPGTQSGNQGIWSEAGVSGLTLVAREGNQAPGVESGVSFASVAVGQKSLRFNEAGQTAFLGGLTGPGVDSSNDTGIWSEGGGGGLALVAREGDAAPGTESGVTFNFFPSGNQLLNNSGHTAFNASLAGSGIDGSNETGIWAEKGSTGLQLVAREGDTAPGMGNGVNFAGFNSATSFPSFNVADQLAFHGRAVGPGVDPNNENDDGIWSEGGGTGLALLAREGEPAPGAGTGANFRNFDRPVLNSAGTIAFRGLLRGPNVSTDNFIGIWSGGAGSLELVARAGDEAPGLGNGATFSAFSPDIVLNAAGQVAFIANTSTTSGIWAQDKSGVARRIVCIGDTIDVDDGPATDLRTISQLTFASPAGNEDGLLSGFNDLGQLTFAAVFTDRTEGVFVSDLATIPEPRASVSLCLMALILVFSRSSERR